MISFVVLSVDDMLRVIILNVVKLSVVILSVLGAIWWCGRFAEIGKASFLKLNETAQTY